MNLPDLLDETITEPAPPFPELAGLITRERRRQRLRRTGAACATAAAVVAVALGAQSFARPAGAPDAGPGDPSAGTTAAVPPPETPAQRYARLSEALRNRLSTVVPGATVVARGGGQSDLFDYLDMMSFRGYDGAIAVVVVATSAGEVELTVQVLRPQQPGPMPTVGVIGRLYGGCATFASDGNTPREPDRYSCTEISGAGGSTISFGWMFAETAQIMQANAVFPNGTLVIATASGDPGSSVLPPAVLASLVSSPAFAA